MVDLKMLEEKTPILKEICSEKEVFWKNPDKTACGEAMEQIELGMEDVEDAERRLERFAPFIMKGTYYYSRTAIWRSPVRSRHGAVFMRF